MLEILQKPSDLKKMSKNCVSDRCNGAKLDFIKLGRTPESRPKILFFSLETILEPLKSLLKITLSTSPDNKPLNYAHFNMLQHLKIIFNDKTFTKNKA